MKSPQICIWCEKELEPKDRVRFLNPNTAQIHFQIHTFPHGISQNYDVIEQSCKDNHPPEHLHEGECTISYCEKVGIEPPTKFETENLIGFTDERELNKKLGNYENPI